MTRKLKQRVHVVSICSGAFGVPAWRGSPR